MRLFISSLSVDNDVVVNPTTDYFVENNRWVAAIRGNIYFSISSGLMELSFDYGSTYTKSIAFANTDKLWQAFIFTNGNILVFGDNQGQKMYLIDSSFTTITEKIVYNPDGVTPYVMNHATGNYFAPLNSMDNNSGTDLYVWGNYSNVLEPDGWNDIPISIFYTSDFGETLKVSYSLTDNLAEVRHVHSIEYNKNNSKFYCCTGDHVEAGGTEIHWLEGSFNGSVWSWKNIEFTENGNPYEVPRGHIKAVGMFFRQISGETWIYWGADDDSVTQEQLGMWRCRLSNFSEVTNHEQLMPFPNLETFLGLSANLETGLVIGVVPDKDVFFQGKKLFMATDFGHGDWEIHEFLTDGISSFSIVNNPTKQGYYKIDTKWRTPEQGKTFWIKTGLDLFNNL